MRLKVPSLKCTVMCGSDGSANSDASSNPDPDPDPDTACTLYSLTVPRLGSISVPVAQILRDPKKVRACRRHSPPLILYACH